MTIGIPAATNIAEDKNYLFIKHRIFEPLAGILILIFSMVWNLVLFMALTDLFSKTGFDWKLLLLLIIFTPVGLISFYLALTAFAGRDKIILEDQRLTAYSGILMLGFTTRLDLIDIESFYSESKGGSSILLVKMKNDRKKKLLAGNNELIAFCLRKLQEHQKVHNKAFYYARIINILKHAATKKAAVSGSLSH